MAKVEEPAADQVAIRDQLVAGTIRLIDEDGLGDLSVRRLATASGRSTMCLYTKFGSRLGLLEAVHEYLGNDLLASIDADDPEAAFSRYVEAHPRRYTFLVEADPELLGMTPSRRADFVARLVATLGPGDPAAGRERLAMVHGQALLRQATAG